MSAKAANPTAAHDERDYIAKLESETRRLQAEAQHIQAEAARLGAQVRLGLWKEMQRSDEFHARYPWVRHVVRSTVVMCGAMVGIAIGLLLAR